MVETRQAGSWFVLRGLYQVQMSARKSNYNTRQMPRFLALLLYAGLCVAQSSVKLVRSLSGPSGKVIGAQFVLDETRNRFVFPQDRALMIAFDWDAQPGDHTMTGVWKGPDGRVVYISPDVRIKTETTQLRGYWTYELYPTTQPGFWSLEVRVDGQPAGSHNFELVIPAQPAPPTAPTVGDVYRSTVNSLVWVHSLDDQGRRIGSANGFVIGKDRVATAFQAIDSATSLDIEFADGKIVHTTEIWDCSRLQDWAIVKVDTRDTPALVLEQPGASFIGERLLVYNVEERATRAFGGVDISGLGNDPVFGPRIQFSPRMPPEAAGGPLLSPAGKVVGIVGGSDRPGSRFELTGIAGRVFVSDTSPRSATPISLVGELPAVPITLKALAEARVLTAPVKPTPNFALGITTLASNSKDVETRPTLVTEFSRRDGVLIYSEWIKRDDKPKGTIGARVYDAQNRAVADVGSRPATLTNAETRFRVTLNLSNSPRGTYRVDIEWNDQPVWRTFVTLID